jgi:hypothetical protein
MQLENRNCLLLPHRPLLGLFCIIFSGLLLTACGMAEELSDTDKPVVPGSLMELCPADVRSSIEGNEEILSITHRHSGEASSEYLITDAGMIQNIRDAILQIQIEDETDLMASDNDDIFIFTLKNENQYFISFNDHHFESGDRIYEISNDSDLWKLVRQIQENQQMQSDS